MGRARGKKGDRGTGEPAPGRWPPELRDLQQRGGMSPDWHEAAHGRGAGIQEIPGSDLLGTGNVVRIANGPDVFINPNKADPGGSEGYWGDLVSREGCQATPQTEEEAILLMYDWLDLAAGASREEHSNDEGEWLGDRDDGVPVRHLLEAGLFDPFLDDQNQEVLDSAPVAIADLHGFASYDPPGFYENETPEEVESLLDDLRPLYDQIQNPDEVRRSITKREIEERNGSRKEASTRNI